MSSTHTEEHVFQAGFKNPGGYKTPVKRSEIQQTTLAAYAIDLTNLRVHDAYHTNLPGTAATDDLALVGGTLGTDAPLISAGDLKAAGATTRYARFQVTLPAEYDTAETVNIRLSAGMKTTIADNTCTVDVEAYEIDKVGAVGADICSTAATDMNSTTFANKDFVITESGLAAGDVLDVRVAIACNDAATGTVVEPQIAYIALLCDVKG